ncbi:MAG: hypothetical protein GY750_01755 [Lentisphaerae bacterium]|nr:hypothetical protein [Lentisphaerota bacterium]MCP4100146.1 hypothetical protein [Lentisphaerota bacterium]
MSVLNNEFGCITKRINKISAKIAHKLLDKRRAAAHMQAAFPAETSNNLRRSWPISHKLAAEAAGLGKPGLSRIILHSEFGAFLCFSAVIIDQEVTSYDKPLEKSLCINCKMCVEACPAGAINDNGKFNFINCLTNNYHYRLGGFIDWVESIANAKSVNDYRKKFSESETLSFAQSLTYGT